MTQQAQNDFHASNEDLALAYADAVNAEIRDVFAAGADIVQLDEPYLQTRPEAAREYAIAAIARAVDAVEGRTALHVCFGYAHVQAGRAKPRGNDFLAELDACPLDIISIEAAQPRIDPAILAELPSKTVMHGVIDLDDPTIETAQAVAERIRAALAFTAPERLMIAPDCGMKYLSRETAFGKLRAMADGAAIVRAELGW